MQIDAVLFPAGKQIRHAVSADAAVQHLNIRAIQAQIRLDQAGIAASHKSAAVTALLVVVFPMPISPVAKTQ